MPKTLNVRNAPPATLGAWMTAMPHLLANLDNYQAGSEQTEETLFYLFPKHQSPSYNRDHLLTHARTYKLYIEQFPRPLADWIARYCPSGTDEATLSLAKLKFLVRYARNNPDDYEDMSPFLLDPAKGVNKFQRETSRLSEVIYGDSQDLQSPANLPTNPEDIAAVLVQTLQDAGFTVGPDPYSPNRYVVTDHKTYRHTGANLAQTIGIAVKQLAILGRI